MTIFRRALPAAVGLAALLVVAGCGGSSTTANAPSTPSTAAPSTMPSTPPSTAAAPTTAAAGVTIAAASVSGVGTVVVDGMGRTLYALTSGGKNVPCDDASGCTKVWPDLPLPSGVMAATAGAGIKASLLATTHGSSGELYPTYGGWNLYAFSGDTAPGQAKGQGLKSFGGTWQAVSVAGALVAVATSGSGSGGY